MANIRPFDLPPAPNVPTSAAFVIDTGAVVQKASAEQIVDSAIPLASQAAAETGSGNDTRMSPLRVQQAINAQALSQDFLAGPDGAGAVGLEQGGTVQQAISWITPTRQSGETDDTLALRRAVQLAGTLGMAVNGGGKEYVIKNDGSATATIIPVNFPRMTVENMKVKIADDCGNYRAIFGPTAVFNIEAWRYEKIIFDKNSVNNLIPSSGISPTYGRYSVTTYQGGPVTGTLVVTGCEFLTSDAVVDVYAPEVSTGSVVEDRPTNRYAAVTSCLWVDAWNGSDTSLGYDQSFINIAADSAIVHGNNFKGLSWERSPWTAIETHSDYTIIADNVIHQFGTGINATVGLRHSAPFSRGIHVSDNVVECCRAGIYIWPERFNTTPDDGREGGSGIQVVDNTIYHQWAKYPYATTPRLNGIAFFATGDSLDISDIRVSGNILVYGDPEGTDAYDRPNRVGTDAAINFYGGTTQDLVIRGFSITDNEVRNAPCAAIKIDLGVFPDFTMRNNRAIDCARTDSTGLSNPLRSVFSLATTFPTPPKISGNVAWFSDDLDTYPVNFLFIRDRGSPASVIPISDNDLHDPSGTIAYLEGFSGAQIQINGGGIPSAGTPVSSIPVNGSWLTPRDTSQASRMNKVGATWRLQAYGTGAPSTGTWTTGSEVINTSNIILGDPGSRYLLDRWHCTAGGSPGTWVEKRTLTGT